MTAPTTYPKVDTTFAATVGFHNCGCGEHFEYRATSMEEYGALNRWVGHHNRCGTESLTHSAERIASALSVANDKLAEIAKLQGKLTNARCEIDDLTLELNQAHDLTARVSKDRGSYQAERDELRDELEDVRRDIAEAEELRTRVQELEAEADARDDAVNDAAEAGESL